MKSAIVALIAVLLMAGTAMAQTPAAPSSTPSPAAAKASSAKAPVVRTAKSLDCSEQADAKTLHGKPRKHFMSTCKKS